MSTIDLSWNSLLLGTLLLIIPVFILSCFKTGLSKSALIAAARMIAQLFLVGFYLNYLFKWNSWIINIAWLLLMICIATYTITNRCKIRWQQYFLPIACSIFISIGLIDAYFLGIVIKLPYLFESQYFIPITGMLLGNMLSTNIIAINTYTNTLQRENSYHQYLLGNGATNWESVLPFVKKSLVAAFNPTIASMAVMGLIALPGTMTGQILGGSNPDVAIKYQIMMMITIFSATLISVMISLRVIARASY